MNARAVRQSGWLRLLVVATLGAAGACAGQAEDQVYETPGYKGARVPLKVMTRNLYLGSELQDVVLSRDQAELLANVNSLWKQVLASDYPARAKLLAAEIASAAPDLVALNEAVIFRLDPVSNFDFAAPAVNAATPAFDFLALLLDELAALSARYVVAAQIGLSDVELPGLAEDGTQFDVRLSDRDVILAKEGLPTSNPAGAPFTKYVELPIAGNNALRVQMKRGYTSVDLVVGGASLVFATAHLEVGGLLATFQENQATELVAALKPRKGQVVLAGDFNSAGDGSTTRSYSILRQAFADPYLSLGPPSQPNTCCADLVTGALVRGGKRIDLVLTRGPISAIDAQVVGVEPGAARTPSGLIASDHAGVVMTLGIKPAAP